MSSSTYTWDHDANRLGVSTTTGSSTSSTAWTYRVDNSIATQATTSGGTAGPTLNYTYDQAGELTTIGSGSTACVTDSYDGLDRLAVSVTAANTGTCQQSVGSTVSYTYDSLDRQHTATVTGSTAGSAVGGNGTTVDSYDGLTSTLVGQTGAVNGTNGRPTDLYELGPAGDHLAMRQTGSSAGTSLMDDDGHGSTTLLLGTSSGAVNCSAAYDPFGIPVGTLASGGNGVCLADGGTTVTTTGNAVWYQGSTRDGTTGAYQYGTRTYTPSISAFTTPDAYRVDTPAQDLGVGTDPLTANTYTYVNGNPENNTDPNGHDPIPQQCNGLSSALATMCRDYSYTGNPYLGIIGSEVGALPNPTSPPVSKIPTLIGAGNPPASSKKSSQSVRRECGSGSWYCSYVQELGGGNGSTAGSGVVPPRVGTAPEFPGSEGSIDIEEIFQDPNILQGMNPGSLLYALGSVPDGYQFAAGQGKSVGPGWKLFDGFGRQVRWSPGTMRSDHSIKGPYWRVSSPEGGKSDQVEGSEWPDGGQMYTGRASLEKPNTPIGRNNGGNDEPCAGGCGDQPIEPTEQQIIEEILGGRDDGDEPVGFSVA